MRRIWWMCAALALCACDDDDNSETLADEGFRPDGSYDLGPDMDAPDASESDTALPDMAPPDPVPLGDCDPLDPAVCSMPWPSSLYLVEDAERTTGYTLTFGETSLPANRDGEHVTPGPYTRMDGYGVGEPLHVRFPNVDISGMAGEDNVARSMADDAAVLWFEVDGETLTRIPYFVELDRWEDDPALKTLFVRPGVLLKGNTRYIVAFRGLTDTSGEAIEPSDAFAALVAGASTDPRRDRFAEIFEQLEAEGAERSTLTLAWDFHTASNDAVHGPLLHMRDAAFEATGEAGPELTVEMVTEFTPEEDEYIAFEIEGTFHVPHYMRESEPYRDFRGWIFNMGDDGLPEQNGWRDPKFWIRVPRSALDGTPHGLVQYGHGLLGKGTQVRGSFNSRIADQNNFIFFACDWTGMSEDDEFGVNVMLGDMSHFPWLADRIHQGMIEALLLARGMRERFGALPEVMERGVVIDPTQLYYSGISQGGIYGATYMAISTDVTRGHLGVPGQNYSTLLHRSVDFTEFFAVIEALYPGRSEQAILLSAVQLLWNGTDPVSYYRHISAEPLPNTPQHHVLAATAKGDYQVAVVTMEMVARSNIGVALMDHYDDTRTVELVEPTAYPHEGSALTNWHFGNPWPELGNKPPVDDFEDPHGKPRHVDAHNAQMVHFFRTGEVIDVCDDAICAPEPEE